MQKPLSFILLIVLALIVFVVGGVALTQNSPTFFGLGSSDFNEHTIYAHTDIPIHVIVADNDLERQRGLSGRETLAVGQGMLFVFDESKKWRIWMKDMQFGIDILWLDKDGRVVDIREYVYPETYNKEDATLSEVFEPRYPARYILEVLVGFTSANGIRIGDKIDIGDLKQ